MKKEDESALKDAKVDCEEKSMSFDEKQKLRTEEIEAIPIVPAKANRSECLFTQI